MEYFGTWEPSSGWFPVLEDKYNNGAWLVLSDGVFEGKNYDKNSWIVGIREKDGNVTYVNVKNLVVITDNSTAMETDYPGPFTKVYISPTGNVIKGDYLQEDDLPEHKHNAENIQGIKEKVLEVAKQLLGGTSNGSAVEFTWDEESQSFTADLKIDEQTIKKDEFGYLFADIENSGSGSSGEISQEQLDEINAKIDKALEELSVANNLVFDSKGIEDEITKDGARKVTLKVDEDVFSYSADRELTLSPTIIEALHNIGMDEDFNNKCNKDVSLEDLKGVEGIQEWLLSLVSETFKFNIQDYIDETTIICNKDGKISAVSLKVQPHTHKIEDIEGLSERLIWAVNQKLNKDENNLDFNEGAIQLKDTTLGTSLYLINKFLAEQEAKLNKLESVVGKAQPSEPDINFGQIEFSGTKIKCYDVQRGSDIKSYPLVECLENPVLKLTKLYPLKGSLTVYVDSEQYIRVPNLENFEEDDTFETLRMTAKEDYYKDLEQFKGWYDCGDFEVALNISEGDHYIQVAHVVDNVEYKSDKVELLSYLNPKPELSWTVSQPTKKTTISGIPGFTEKTVKVKIEADNVVSTRYLAADIKAFITYDLQDISDLSFYYCKNKSIVFDEFSFEYPELFENQMLLVANLVLNGKALTSEKYLDKYRFDGSDIEEKYRITWPVNDQTLEWSSYDSTQNISKTTEACILRGSIDNPERDYQEFEGPNYTGLSQTIDNSGYRFAALKIDLKKPILRPSHLKFKLQNKYGESYKQNTKTGEFEDFKCLIGLVSGESCLAEIDANKPYDFQSILKDNSRKYPGLDLYHSEDSTITVTLGKNSEFRNLTSVIIKIGCLTTKSIDLEKLLDSLEVV